MIMHKFLLTSDRSGELSREIILTYVLYPPYNLDTNVWFGPRYVRYLGFCYGANVLECHLHTVNGLSEVHAKMKISNSKMLR